jgi:hypothetical protein
MKKHIRSDRGAVAIFIVIFTALLVTVISVSFIRLMVQTQQQAATADLSQSAHDSALAGVEDAKRLLVTYQKECIQSAPPADRCATLDRLLRVDTPCSTIQEAGIEGSPSDKEVLVKRSEGDKALDQAYTCVKVMIETNDFIGTVNRNASRVVPLKGTGEFNEVTLQWFSQTDLQNSSDDPGAREINVPQLSGGLTLPKLSDWPANRPSLLRAQLIQFGSTFKLSDFDKTTDGGSNAHTLFLYPLQTGRDNIDFAEDTRLSKAAGVLHPVTCDPTFSTTTADKNYACKVTLKLPAPVGATDGTRAAYLRLDPVYNNLTHFSVNLQNNGEIVKFKDVQPIVDSTGRANDLFRRVQSRVELESDVFPYPESAVDLTGSLCKTFLVTDRATDYSAGLCDPHL